MKTKALRLYGKDDLRLEEFELGTIGDDEILAEIVTDSICMSSYKAALQGGEHKRVPADVSENPIIIGHEFCGIIREVGANWQHKYKAGQNFAIQPALNYKGSLAALGYSYHKAGGCATYVVLPAEAMITDSVLEYKADVFFHGSLAEPMSCIVGGYHAMYHTTPGSYEHEMGIKEGGNLIIMAGAGPLGMGAIDYAIAADRKPGLVVVTDIDDARLARAEKLITPARAKENGVKLVYVNTSKVDDAKQYLMDLTDGEGYHDILIMAPVKPVCELADSVLGFDGCVNFFAGPMDHEFSANINFYDLHYNAAHYMGTSGGNTDDMRESLRLMEQGRLNPAVMVTHVGGIGCAKDSTLNLPKIPGGKKLIYTHIDMPLTAIDDFAKLGETDPMFKKLAEITERNNGLWSAEAEKYLLENK